MDKDNRLAADIETKFILNNHEEVLKILDEHANLIFNNHEKSQPELLDAIMHYERHIAVYKALRAINDPRRPVQLGEEWPAQLSPLIKARSTQLEAQRQSLLRILEGGQ